jgi:hypothetical protein
MTADPDPSLPLVTIHNPETGATVDVPASSLPHHFRAGWRPLVEDDPPPDDAPPPDPEPVPRSQARKAAKDAAKPDTASEESQQ